MLSCIRPVFWCLYWAYCLCKAVFYIRPNSVRWLKAVLLCWGHHSLALKGQPWSNRPLLGSKHCQQQGRICIAFSDLQSLRHLICNLVVLCKSLQKDAMVNSATCHVIMAGVFAERDWMWFERTVHRLFDDPGSNNSKAEYCRLCRDLWKTRQSHGNSGFMIFSFLKCWVVQVHHRLMRALWLILQTSLCWVKVKEALQWFYMSVNLAGMVSTTQPGKQLFNVFCVSGGTLSCLRKLLYFHHLGFLQKKTQTVSQQNDCIYKCGCLPGRESQFIHFWKIWPEIQDPVLFEHYTGL